MQRSRFTLWVACLFTLFSGASLAHAAPRTTHAGKAFRWRVPSITLTLAARSVPPSLNADDVLKAMREAAATWTAPQVTCTSLSIAVTLTDIEGTVENDGVNIVAFRSRAWCRDGFRSRGACYDPRTAAMTTVHPGAALEDSSRAIDDADIELNAVGFDWSPWSIASNQGSEAAMDLREVLRHELGHVAGFRHVCEQTSRAPRGAPACEALTGDALHSVMLPGADTGVSSTPTGRRLTQDDVERLCAVYPAQVPSKPVLGCTVAPRKHASSTPIGLVLALAATLYRLGRREPRRPMGQRA